MKTNQTSDKNCLSCPNMITEGEYCKECSDTPDGRAGAEEEIREAFENSYEDDHWVLLPEPEYEKEMTFDDYEKGYKSATQKAQAEIEEYKYMNAHNREVYSKHIKELEQQLEEWKGEFKRVDAEKDDLRQLAKKETT